MTQTEARATQAAATGGVVLLTLCAGQFLMALDSSVMNVSIATVAEDLGTSITGIQSAIVLYTLVMAMLMVTGGKIGSMIGRKRAFLLGLIVYCSGSLTTAIAPNLGVLLFGWSLLEGIGIEPHTQERGILLHRGEELHREVGFLFLLLGFAHAQASNAPMS